MIPILHIDEELKISIAYGVFEMKLQYDCSICTNAENEYGQTKRQPLFQYKGRLFVDLSAICRFI